MLFYFISVHSSLFHFVSFFIWYRLLSYNFSLPFLIFQFTLFIAIYIMSLTFSTISIYFFLPFFTLLSHPMWSIKYERILIHSASINLSRPVKELLLIKEMQTCLIMNVTSKIVIYCYTIYWRIRLIWSISEIGALHTDIG